ncbi:MAG: biotin/lipoyl-binding protein [Calditrichaeota bacterium]|nr:biotin/lipoyl-binding protein [Calditrichota bacterium]
MTTKIKNAARLLEAGDIANNISPNLIMKLIVQVEQRRLEIELPDNSATGTVLLDGLQIVYDFKPLASSGLYSLVLNGRAFLIDVEPIHNDRCRVQVNGVDYEVSTIDERREQALKIAGAKSDAGPTAGELHAPMPGLVVKLSTSSGQPVNKGQGVIVIEAMKMENEIGAPIDGVVERILVKSGQAVEKGELLLTIKC